MQSRVNTRKKRQQTKGSQRNKTLPLVIPKQTPTVQVADIWLPITISLRSLTAASTFSEKRSVSNAGSFASPSGTIIQKFLEWRLVETHFMITPVSTTVGSSLWFISEDDSLSASTYSGANYRIIPHTNSGQKQFTMKWRSADYASMAFLRTDATLVEYPSLYGFTDNTNFGTPASVTSPMYCISGFGRVQLRGLNTA